MTSYDLTGEFIVPREVTFSGIELPTKRAVSIIFEDGTTRSVTFSFSFNEYNDDVIVEIYWWVAGEKIIGHYGRIEEYYAIEVRNLLDTGVTEFILLPTTLGMEEIVDNQVKTIRMSPRLWIYEVDEL